MDLLCSLIVLGVAAIAVLGLRKTHGLHPRVVAEGASPLVPGGALHALYRIVEVVGNASVALGITANAITAFSFVAAVLAALLFAAGQLGAGALLALVAAGSDAFDGYVARRTGQASDAGELLDAAVDRYVEFALFTGLALHLRGSALALALVLTAYAGSFMVSYSSAKADALRVTPPRGGMRRTERLVLLILGPAFTVPLVVFGHGAPWTEAPLFVALTLIAVLSHTSALLRLAYVMRSLRATAGRVDGEGAPGPRDLGVHDRSRG